MAGLMNRLDQFYKAGNFTTGVLTSATKHEDSIFVSRCYNWKSGSWKGVYTHAATYKLKADAPDNALETISKEMVVPMMENLLADGAVLEYELDTQAIHTESPSMFYIFYITANAEDLDKVNAALHPERGWGEHSPSAPRPCPERRRRGHEVEQQSAVTRNSKFPRLRTVRGSAYCVGTGRHVVLAVAGNVRLRGIAADIVQA